MHRVFSCVVGRVCLLWPVCSLSKTLLPFTLHNLVHQGQICLLFQVFIDYPLLHSSPLWCKGHLFWVLVLEGLVGLHRTIRILLFQHYCLGHAAAKSLQSCPTLCNPRDGSPPGFPVPGILQARTLEWVAIFFSSAWKWKVKVKSLSRVWF